MLRSVWCFLLAAALSGAVLAQPAKWQVDQAKSSLTFVVNINGQPITGKFKAFGALIAFDPADLAHSSAKITMDMTEVKSGDATRDAMLLKPDWFNVLDFPQAVYQTTGFVAKGGNAYEAQGKLTLKGVVQDIALPFKLTIDRNTAIARGETKLQRLVFSVGRNKEFMGDTPVGLSVKVMVNVTAKRIK